MFSNPSFNHYSGEVLYKGLYWLPPGLIEQRVLFAAEIGLCSDFRSTGSFLNCMLHSISISLIGSRSVLVTWVKNLVVFPLAGTWKRVVMLYEPRCLSKRSYCQRLVHQSIINNLQATANATVRSDEWYRRSLGIYQSALTTGWNIYTWLRRNENFQYMIRKISV